MRSLTAALLATTCLTTLLASLALADGGAGGPVPGISSAAGGAGGTGFTGNPGQGGTGLGGGGGGGAGGGAGGAGGGDGSGSGAGGAGGTSSNPNGQSGNPSNSAGSAGGGGGGWNGNGAGAATISNGSPLAGGRGGNGGDSTVNFGGGGGAGGYGAVVVTGIAPSSNTSTITGGTGGTGGFAARGTGYGGDGGVGAHFIASGALFTNSGSGIVSGGTGGRGGTITNNDGSTFANGGGGGAGIVAIGLAITNIGTIAGGAGGSGGGGTSPGNGGAGGAGISISGSGHAIVNSGNIAGGHGGQGVNGGIGGAGGAGIVGSGLAITNSGTITGGFANGGSGAQANAITFTGGTNSLTLQAGSNISGNVVGTGSNALALGGNSNSSFAVSAIGSGAQFQGFSTYQKTGSSTWTLTGTTTAVTSWNISAGTLSVSADSNLGASSGGLTLNGGALQSTATFSSDRNVTLGAGNGTFDTASGTLTLNGVISGTGNLFKTGSGTLTLTGSNTHHGPTVVRAGTLVVNGSIPNSVTVDAAGTLRGTGSIGGLIVIGGIVAPGRSNSIGTLTANGGFVMGGGAYQVAVNSAGQNGRLNVVGGPGSAAISEAAVTATALSGNYGSSTKYTILSAGGGVTGSFSGVSLTGSSLLSPSLSYDNNNVYLTLTVNPGAFSGAGSSTNQRAVGAAFDRSFDGAGGDFGTVVGTLFGLTSAQLPAAYDALSGQPIANFGTVNVQSAALFMSALGQQMALARGGATGGGERQALAQICEIATCETAASPFSAWGSLLGGLGSVQGDANANTLTYNFGGAAAGIDYRIAPRFLVGIGAGYSHGTQWVNNFLGQGWTDSVSVAAYASFTQSGFYADALAGYAYYGNQMQRQIVLPGLQPRTATGSTGANQFLGQVETGYRIGVYAPAAASLTPFARLQGSTATQNGFSESGAQSLSLNVAQQTTSSLRTLFGADLAGSVPLGSQRSLDLGLRLGWQHEYANTARPMTAAFNGAPFAAFTVYGATPQRDAAVIGFSAKTRIADSTQLYLRYDGELSTGSDYHALNIGVRFSW